MLKWSMEDGHAKKLLAVQTRVIFFLMTKKIGKVDLGQKPNIISTKKAWKPNAQVINQDLYNPGLVMLLVAVLQIGCRKLGVFVDCSTLVEEMI